MSDWQVGDLAVCVDAGLRQSFGPHLGCGLVLGRIYRVEAIGAPSIAGLPTLIVSEVGRKIADRFRKILPDKHEECEPEFVTLLKRIKRTVSA